MFWQPILVLLIVQENRIGISSVEKIKLIKYFHNEDGSHRRDSAFLDIMKNILNCFDSFQEI